jgi:RNA polymerase sigma-70 factor (ECF subfamily)
VSLALLIDEQAVRSWPSSVERRARLAREHYQFIWRSLRRLGVSVQSVDDAAQQVFMVAAQKIERIEPGCERAFLFQTALRVAMSIRRAYAQRREDVGDEPFDTIVDRAPLPDERAVQQQQRAHLDRLLDALPMDLRAPFVLYEIEGTSSPEIAALLDLPIGTVASRLRRARELFQKEAERLRKRLQRKRGDR